MKKSYEFIILSIISIILTIYLFLNKFTSYAIFTSLLTIILIILSVIEIINNKDEKSVYNSKLKKILKTYDAILVEGKNLPSLDDKNIIIATNIEHLIDAQSEIRKPIYYKKETDTCSFVLLDNNEACIYILRKNDKSLSEVDLTIKENKFKKRKKVEKELLDEIDKTTIISLDNHKKYKISPVREKKNKRILDTQAIAVLNQIDLPKLKEK